ncbi:MAG: AMP-binding protein, partial [bacterium]|nr:AMP-binding protein [bacterium]
MDEYRDNASGKLAPFITKETRILEIGCASGITMFGLAPLCGFYYGTDLSGRIIQRTRGEAEKKGFKHIRLEQRPAHEIHQLEEKDFDIIILNSVIQSFSGFNYLRDVLGKAMGVLKDRGRIFIGDIWDQDLKDEFVRDLETYKLEHSHEGVRTKTDRSSELFLSRSFFDDLRSHFPHIARIDYSKIDASESEISRYGFDLIMEIHRRPGADPFSGLREPGDNGSRHRYQYDRRALDRLPVTPLADPSHSRGLCYLIYTSGSTGTPRGVMVEHRSVFNMLQAFHPLHHPAERQLHLVLTFSFTFDPSVQYIFASLLHGHSLHMALPEVKKDGRRHAAFLREQVIDVGDGTPSLFALLVKEYCATRVPCGVKCFIIGGETFSLELVKDFYSLPEHRDVSLTNVYGPTECTINATGFPMDGETWRQLKRVPIGKPLCNCRLYILDDQLRMLPVGVPGEICIAGDGVSRGYWNDETRTAEKFTRFQPMEGEEFERIYRTGDLGRWLEDGNLEFLGRNDHQVKVRGYRIELGEVKHWLRLHPLVEDAVVLARDLGNDGNELVAYIVGHEDLNITMMRDHLKMNLIDYMIPSYFVRVESFPLTMHGKIDRKALPSPAEASLDSGSDTIAPRNDLEKRLAAIWEKVLNIRRISVNDNFFDIGGHSLLAVRLMSRIEEEFGKDLPLATLFNHSTIEGLAILLAGGNEPVQWSPLVAIKEPATGNQPPIYCFHPVGGTALCYNDLSQALGVYQPFYVFQALGLEEGQEPLGSVEEMADYYIEQLLARQPRGPYLLSGWSFGGLVAYETACRLVQRGHSVALTALLDCSAVKTDIEELMSKDDAGYLADFLGQLMPLSEEELRKMNPEEQVAHVVQVAREHNVVPEDFGIPQTQRLLTVFKNNGMSILKYNPKPYPGKIVLFRPEEESRLAYMSKGGFSRGWENFAQGGVDTIEVPGHHGNMLAAPNATVLAQRLEHCIKEAIDEHFRGNGG